MFVYGGNCDITKVCRLSLKDPPRAGVMSTFDSSQRAGFLHVIFWKYTDLPGVPSIWHDLIWSMHLPISITCLILAFAAVQSAFVFSKITRFKCKTPEEECKVELRAQKEIYKHKSAASKVKDIPCAHHKVEFDVAMDSGRQKFLRKLREVVHL